MTRPAVYLRTAMQRERALEELVGSLLRRNIPVAVASLDRIHLHVLVQCPDHNPRHQVGIAKRESSHYCKVTGHAPIGGIWGDGCECKPITGDEHFENARDYIADHAKRGAAMYCGTHTLFNPLAHFDPNDLLVG